MKQAAPIACGQVGHADGSSGVAGRAMSKWQRAAYHARPRLLAEPIAHNHTERALDDDRHETAVQARWTTPFFGRVDPARQRRLEG